MEDFQKKINLMKKKIDNIRSDIESIRGEDSTGHTTYTSTSKIQNLTSNNKPTPKNHFLKSEYHSNETSSQSGYKKHLFIPRSKTAQNTMSCEETPINIPKHPQSRTKYTNTTNPNSTSLVNNNSTANNSIVYNFDYRMQYKSMENNNHIRKHNSQHNTSRKHHNDMHIHNKNEDSDCYILNSTDLFRRKMPIPNNANAVKVNSIDDANSCSLNPEKVFSPIHNNSVNHNKRVSNTYTKVMNVQMQHRRNKTSECAGCHSVNRGRGFVGNSMRNVNQMRMGIVDSEDIVRELIDISNEYYGDDNENVTPGFIVENYKRLLRENKTHSEFIMRLKKLYINSTGKNYKENSNTMVDIWKWINHLIRNSNNNSNKSKIHLNNMEMNNTSKQNEYQQYCETIMKEYGLKTMHDFSIFIDKLLKKSNKNETFLEGIKKLLMVENKIDEYSK